MDLLNIHFLMPDSKLEESPESIASNCNPYKDENNFVVPKADRIESNSSFSASISWISE